LKLLRQVRDKGIDAELYPSFDAKLKKQMKYADDRKARFVALIGESEMQKDVVLLKDMISGEQVELKSAEFLNFAWI